MSFSRNSYHLAFVTLFAQFFCFTAFAKAEPFDFSSGNAAREIILPAYLPVTRDVSPRGNDATLILRFTTLVANAWFDAIAPYHPTAVGVYSKLERRPADESIDNRNMNIAMLYSSYRVLNSLFPKHTADWRNMLLSLGLDPEDDQVDPRSPIGIGNLAGNAIVQTREHDGMNQLGDEGGVIYNKQPYTDYLGYQPTNSPYVLRNPSKWQPNITTDGYGLFKVQQFVTPQLRVTLPYSYDRYRRFAAPRPSASNVLNIHEYKNQADEVLAASAALTDEQKMMAELFDDKLRGLGQSILYASVQNELDLIEFVHYDFLSNMAAFDTAIAIWGEKYRYNAVRPFSAIRYLYGNQPVTAWGGSGQGTVDDIPASQWKSYLAVADHPEYPSGSASFCAAHAQIGRKYLGSDKLDWSIPVAQGASRIEPGITPSEDIVLHFETWTHFEETCGLSRFWGGVHFLPSISAGQDIGHQVAELAYQFVLDHINGKAP